MLHLLIATGVFALIVAPLPLVGRWIEYRRHRATLAATVHRERPEPWLAPVRFLNEDDRLAARQRWTGGTLDRFEAKLSRGLDALVERAFADLGISPVEGALIRVTTGEYALVSA